MGQIFVAFSEYLTFNTNSFIFLSDFMRKSKTSVLKGMPTIIPIEKSDAFIYFVYVKISNHHMLFQRPLSKSEFVENCYASTYKQVWQYRLWRFKSGDTKLEWWLPKNQFTQYRLLNFDNSSSGRCQKVPEFDFQS